MSEIAIRVESLSKQYKITATQRRHDTLREQITEGVKSVFRGNVRSLADENMIWAMKDVSFEIKQGEIIGIIGRNGAGKSTLLKILSRITEPTSGKAEIYGRVGSLLEVGTGFDRELSGRENVYLNGAILGMRKAEIDRKFDEIVTFAEVEKFIDTPIKHYSSGMYVRLAFAVAAHLEPEILLVDEVLAVGDTNFQKKCLGKMDEVSKGGRTVLFVSHNMAAITYLCKSGIWLDNGQLEMYDNAEQVVGRYLAAGVQELGEVAFPEPLEQASGTDYIRLRRIRIRDHLGLVNTCLDVRLPFVIEIEYSILKRVTNLRVGFSVIAQDGTVVFSSTDMDDGKYELERIPGTYISSCKIPGDFLNWGRYFVSAGSDFPMIQTHFFADRVISFNIEQTGGVGGHVSDGRRGLLRMNLPWSIRGIG